MIPVICVTEKEYYKAEDVFRACTDYQCMPLSLNEATLSAALIEKKAFGCILGVDIYKEQLYSSLPKGAIIARFGVGHDGVDKQKATEAGIIVTNTPGVLDDSVAEHAIWLMGTLARSIPSQNSLMKSKNWQPQIGNELKGKTLLIVGCGAIGRKVAKIASFGLGMKVLGYDVADLDTKRMKNDFGIEMLEGQIEEEICKADYISIHLPSIDATRNYVNSRFLSHMKNTAYLINTARGAVLDERALYDTLKSGQIAGAALDVFETEPYKPINSDKDLRTLDNIILTPHIGSSTVEACQRMAKRCLFNIKAAFEKRYDELDIINPHVLEKL
jgi:lactate dehydrogenase-like 2-hydroxyacid dehydrogenase